MTTKTNTKTEATVASQTSAAEPVKTPAELIAQYGNVSKAIRGLSEKGLTKGQIAKALNKRYQHVRNVLITPVKKSA